MRPFLAALVISMIMHGLVFFTTFHTIPSPNPSPHATLTLLFASPAAPSPTVPNEATALATPHPAPSSPPTPMRSTAPQTSSISADSEPSTFLPSSPEPTPRENTTVAARIVSRPPPSYPVASLRLKEEGTVVLSVHISPTGSIIETQILQSSGYPRLDTAAQQAVSNNWKFSAQVENGLPVAVWYQVPIAFTLQDE